MISIDFRFTQERMLRWKIYFHTVVRCRFFFLTWAQCYQLSIIVYNFRWWSMRIDSIRIRSANWAMIILLLTWQNSKQSHFRNWIAIRRCKSITNKKKIRFFADPCNVQNISRIILELFVLSLHQHLFHLSW